MPEIINDGDAVFQFGRLTTVKIWDEILTPRHINEGARAIIMWIARMLLIMAMTRAERLQ